MPKDPVYVRSIVTTSLADKVAAAYGVTPVKVLTGFKYIGETILHLEQKNQQNRFIFGFEESYGYLAGTYVRDKDAVVASMSDEFATRTFEALFVPQGWSLQY